MKILPFALACSSILAFAVACDSDSAIQSCTVDADCLDAAAPTCVDGFCGANNDECAVAKDCQIAYNAGDDASPECSADSDCDEAAQEICATGFDGVGFCVASDDGSGACEDAGGVSVDVGGDNACLDPEGDRQCVEGLCDNT